MRKLIDDQQFEGERLSVFLVYDRIKRSNSSLNRRSKKMLEESIERVLDVIKGDEDESESIEGDFEGLEVKEEPPAVGHPGYPRLCHSCGH